MISRFRNHRLLIYSEDALNMSSLGRIKLAVMPWSSQISEIYGRDELAVMGSNVEE